MQKLPKIPYAVQIHSRGKQKPKIPSRNEIRHRRKNARCKEKDHRTRGQKLQTVLDQTEVMKNVMALRILRIYKQ